MAILHHHTSADNIHTITLQTDRIIEKLSTQQIIEALVWISEQFNLSDKQQLRVIIDLSCFHLLPLRNLAIELRRFYEQEENINTKIALVVQPALVEVLNTMTRTYVKRDSIQLFTQLDKAELWLTLQNTSTISA
ncbi:MAG: hypothetical protein AAFV93_13805 [Chloroflexota bacterium]